MEALDTLLKLLVIGVVGVVWFDVRTIRNDTKKELKEISKAQSTCQADLPKTYATRESVGKLHGRTDKIESDVSFLKGKLNGQVAN